MNLHGQVLVNPNGELRYTKMNPLVIYVDTSAKYPISERTDSPPAGLISVVRDWTNTDGAKIKAGIKRIEGTNVVFVIDGKEVVYPISKLNVLNRERVRKLRQKP